jgi:dihydroflavonol-4-reductase
MILVTGASGFIGRELTLQLLKLDEPVRALGREPGRLAELATLGAEPLRVPLEDGRGLRRAATGCRLVFHAAGLVSHERRDRARLLEANGEGVRRLLEATDADARVVLVSSAFSFGPAATSSETVDEHGQPPEWLVASPYCASKLLGERYALEAVEAGRDVVVANAAYVIGPGQRGGLPSLLRKHLRGLVRLIVPGGFSYVDVRDVASGLQRAAERGRTGERYLLASRSGNFSHGDFLALAGRLAQRSRQQLVLPTAFVRGPARLLAPPLRRAELREAAHWWFYDQGKAERELGFRVRPPAETLTDVLAELGYGGQASPAPHSRS